MSGLLAVREFGIVGVASAKIPAQLTTLYQKGNAEG